MWKQRPSFQHATVKFRSCVIHSPRTGFRIDHLGGYQENIYHCRIVHSPEFLTAANADFDFQNPDRNIIGGDDKETINSVKNLYQKIFPDIECIEMTSNEESSIFSSLISPNLHSTLG